MFDIILVSGTYSASEASRVSVKNINTEGDIDMRENVVQLFWKYINNADFDSLNKIMSDGASIWLANTKEVFNRRDNRVLWGKFRTAQMEIR